MIRSHSWRVNCRTFVSVSRLRGMRSRAPIRCESSALLRSPACNSSCRCALLPCSPSSFLSSFCSLASYRGIISILSALISFELVSTLQFGVFFECVEEKREFKPLTDRDKCIRLCISCSSTIIHYKIPFMLLSVESKQNITCVFSLSLLSPSGVSAVVESVDSWQTVSEWPAEASSAEQSAQ